LSTVVRSTTLFAFRSGTQRARLLSLVDLVLVVSPGRTLLPADSAILNISLHYFIS